MFVRRALAFALLIPLFLAGCAGEPKPKMPDPPSVTPTPTPTESETPQAESAEDFVRRWQASGDEMQVTGDTDAYRKMSADCQACTELADRVAAIYADGGHVKFAGSTIMDLDRLGMKPPTFEVSLSVPKTVIQRTADGDAETLPKGRMRIRVTAQYQSGNWVVTHYGIL